MNYTVYYKKPHGLIWHRVKNVEGDSIMEDAKGNSLPMRVLLLANKTRLEIPITCFIKFSKERFYAIQANIEKESGQKTRLN